MPGQLFYVRRRGQTNKDSSHCVYHVRDRTHSLTTASVTSIFAQRFRQRRRITSILAFSCLSSSRAVSWTRRNSKSNNGNSFSCTAAFSPRNGRSHLPTPPATASVTADCTHCREICHHLHASRIEEACDKKTGICAFLAAAASIRSPLARGPVAEACEWRPDFLLRHL